MGKEFVSEKEKKNRKRGILFAFFFHAALVIFGLLPFLTKEMKEPTYEKVIEIQFAQFDASSSNKADEKAGAKKKTEQKKTTEKKVETPKPKEKPQPKPLPEKPKPVLTSENTKTPPIKTAPKPTKVEKPKPQTKPSPKPVEEVEETSEAATESKNESSGNSAENGKGKGDYGKDKGEGTQGNGKEGDDFTGTAIFSRKVIYRPDIKKIVKKDGRIAINLCINNDGRVVYVKYDKESSTIRDTDNIRKTLEATKLYKFERDYTVPKQQCGKLTFIIDNNG